MKKRFLQYSFAKQLRTYFILLFLAVFAFCVSWYYLMAMNLANRSEDEALENRLEMISGSLDALLSNVNDYSKVIAYNEVVQESLEIKSDFSYSMQTALQETVIQLAACCDGIASIYVFRANGEACVAGNIRDVDAIRQQVLGIESYSSVFEMMQKTKIGAGILLHRMSGDGNSEVISYARTILSLDSLEPIGILVTNIPLQKIKDTFIPLQRQDGLLVAILDEEGEVITGSDGYVWLTECAEQSNLAAGREAYQKSRREGGTYKVGRLSAANGMYQILVAMPRSSLLLELNRYMQFTVIILIIGLALCVGGAYAITRQMGKPLKNILTSMKGVQEERLERIELCEVNEELNTLQTGYNRMLGDMETLMNQRVNNQRMRRKYELELLQAQIKPHFLYNTLDSVCALALMGNTQDVFTMVQALGQYYRNSLHKGKEIITIGEELEIVGNYLIIQGYRFDDVFQVVYDVDEEVKKFSIIKLILQPLVENAIYHGFREHERSGTITIRVKDEDACVVLSVEDDGMGMKPERLEQVLSSTEENRIKRFGLFGTIQRLRLYYEAQNLDVVTIESEYGEGTRIRIRIPKRYEMEE